MSNIVNKGKVKWRDAKKKYGFIVPDDQSPDIFMHDNDVRQGGPLMELDQVEYEISTQDPRGRRAVNIKLIARIPAPTNNNK